MGYIVIDTCVWLNLASTPALHPLVEELERYAGGSPHTLVAPESVKIEFRRNQPEISKRWEASLKGYISGLPKIRRLVPDEDLKISEIITASERALRAGASAIASAEGKVADLIARARKHEHRPEEYVEASRRCLEHRPPASTPQRSSIGDCLLWIAAVGLLREHCVWFCTENYRDFSGQRQDQLHPDLEAEVKGKGHQLYYFNDPSKLLADLNDRSGGGSTADLPKYADYFPPVPGVCPKCGGEPRDAGYSPSLFGAWTWKKRCSGCGNVWDTGEFMDD